MKTIRPCWNFLFLLFFGVVALICSCVNEPYLFDRSKVNESLVTFSVKVPSSSTRSSRSLSSVAENAVNHITVLLFDDHDNYLHYPLYSDDVVSKTSNEVTFSVKIPQGTYHSLVVLANSKEMVDDVVGTLGGGVKV